jgi:magnesium transporter
MINAYVNLNDRVEKVDLETVSGIPEGTVWIDLYRPTIQEEKLISNELKISIPTREEMDKIEVMSPFYKEGNAHYMTVTALDKSSSDHPDSAAITFILTTNCLITIRHTKPSAILNFASRAVRLPYLCNSTEVVLSSLMDALVNKIADILEEIGNDLDKVLKSIFDKSSKKDIISGNRYNNIIRKIGNTGNMISKNRESLVSLNRLLIYSGQIDDAEFIRRRENRMRFKHLAREVYSLSEYANFLSQRNSFLLDATLGMISVEQNIIIKIFTVAAAVFMPPTLIASIYGMNFKHMPELETHWGYPLALVAIVSSALIP